ncbi:MAG: hypothetical protein QOH88_472 [Verrucomicrobiota bacterium]|jgi:hypothetical protein
MKATSILIAMLIAAHLLVSCDESPTSSSSTTSSQLSANSVAGAWKTDQSPLVLFLENDGSARMGAGDEKKGEGTWSFSGDRLKIQFTIHGAPLSSIDAQVQMTDKNHMVTTANDGKVDHWTRQ